MMNLPNIKYDKSVGIIGGMGSFATCDFFYRLVSSFPAEKEWDRPRILIDNRCTMPSRVRAILYNENYDLVLSNLVDSTEHLLDSGADILVLACNTSHVFLSDIEYLSLSSFKPSVITSIFILLPYSILIRSSSLIKLFQ